MMRYLTAVVLVGSFNGPGMDSYEGIEPDSTVETKRSPAEQPSEPPAEEPTMPIDNIQPKFARPDCDVVQDDGD